jgi:hypothetical protein
VKRVPHSETLSEYLERWAEQQQRQAARSAKVRPAPVPAFKPEPERSTLMKTITIGGQPYTWEQLSRPEVRRALLPMVEAMIAQVKADPAAYGYTAADVQAAVRYTTGEFDNTSEDRMREIFPAQGEPEIMPATLTKPFAPAAPVDGRTAYQEVARIAGSPEGRAALQRRANGQPLDAAQTALIRRHDEFLAANNAQALREHPPTGGMMGRTDKYIPTAVRELAKLEPVQPAHRAREMAAALRKDERWTNPNHPEHAQANYEMELLYQGQYREGGNEPVIDEEK